VVRSRLGAARLGLHAGQTIRLRDRSSNAVLAFTITGLYAERELSGPAAAYWQLDSVPASGASTEGGFTTYGPLAVDSSAFSLRLSAASVSPGHLLADHARQRPGELSGGQQQRVAIARALASRPALLLADEPTGQPDTETGKQIMRLLRAVVRSEGVTALVATHDPTLMELADEVLQLEDGQISPG
jgi:ATPase subunit of ABC transporter with duplicated ATPase domains